MNKEKIREEFEAEIMDWYYESVKINFGVDIVQDATDLRKIIDYQIDRLLEEIEGEVGEAFPEKIGFASSSTDSYQVECSHDLRIEKRNILAIINKYKKG